MGVSGAIVKKKWNYIWVCMLLEVANDLIGCDAATKRLSNGIPGQNADNQIREPGIVWSGSVNCQLHQTELNS